MRSMMRHSLCGACRNFTNIGWLCRARTWSHCLILILTLNIIFYLNSCPFFTDPADIKNWKHGFVNELPDHHFISFRSRLGEDVKDTLRSSVPPTVHYFWCQTGSFQFQHYLSVLSAYKLLQPSEIIFHYNSLPERDDLGYYQYFEDLLRDLPNLFPEPLSDSRACHENSHKALEYISDMLNKQGGVVLGVNVVLSENILQFMNKPISLNHVEINFASTGVLMMSPNVLTANTKTSILTSPTNIQCSPNSTFRNQHHPCAVLLRELFPVQIFHLHNDFGELARFVGYGQKESLVASPQKDLIPNIVHYVWLGDNYFTFFNQLCLLSALHIQKAEKIYIHGNKEPRGIYWEEVKNLPQVQFIFRDFPHFVFGNELNNPSHASDILRVDVLLRYGGVYLDWDILLVKPLSEGQRKYEALVCVDWPQAGHYPDTFNMGIMAGKQGATFLQFMMESFRHYVDRDWAFNAIQVPYKVYEQHPDSVLLDRHLQVICFKGSCHPTWRAGYKEIPDDVQDSPQFDWKTEANGIHWTFPDPTEFSDKKTLLASTGLYADIGKYVLHQVGG
ncbi:uncharacterized protein LOC124133254 [Haliotis rufescens]|uniref:uncharacterized protein LOC124133254 n=1 Tax=Haliotis rufescens TaxID=6454 RepID=UPI00201F612C|nr:uncharacterized protein LOC124133254 [Haliotis rufescens]XP_046353544.2 uncharacterized protein LOC124133254 [Haliotis rufescens]XP_046353545.2 uncharacterized protein LOC124133254 [Haliotis rufescens]